MHEGLLTPSLRFVYFTLYTIIDQFITLYIGPGNQ